MLLVDDFAEVTPALLRSAYVEAIYHADLFEYERLKQSYWYSVIYNVSQTGHAGPMIDAFPMHAQKKGFIRPKIPFHCGDHNEHCGSPIVHTPKSYC